MGTAADRQTDPWERRAAFIAAVGLVVALLVTLGGYIFLLSIGQPTGTLDNLASLALGAVAGATTTAAVPAISSAVRRSDREPGRSDSIPGGARPESAPSVEWPTTYPTQEGGS